MDYALGTAVEVILQDKADPVAQVAGLASPHANSNESEKRGLRLHPYQLRTDTLLR